MGKNDLGGSRDAKKSKRAKKNSKNQSPHIEVKLGSYRSTRCPDSNGVKDTQI